MDKTKETYTQILSKQTEEDVSPNLGKRAGESYQYLNAGHYKTQLEISSRNCKKGQDLLKAGKIKLDNVTQGYLESNGEMVYQFDATGIQQFSYVSSEFPIQILLDRKKVLQVSCSCSDCASNYFYYRSRELYCGYTAGCLDLIEDYLSTHNIGDATDNSGHRMIASFQTKKASRIISDNRNQNQSVTLEPKIIQKEGKAALGFRIGTNKLFVIKDLVHFARNVKYSREEVYGSNTLINHGMQNFKPEVRKWIRFIFDVVEEEERLQEKIREKAWHEKNLPNSAK